MEQLTTRRFAGIDLEKRALLLSVYDEAGKEMEEMIFPIPEEDQDNYMQAGLNLLLSYWKEKAISPEDFSRVIFCLEDCGEDSRQALRDLLPADFARRHGCHVISRLRAFAEYVFHQEKVVWDRNTLLLNYSGDLLQCIRTVPIRQTRQKGYRGTMQELDLAEAGIVRGAPDQDSLFGKMIRQFLAKNPSHIVFLTGEGFEGSWMKKTLTYLCSGRRVFLGQNIYAGGACLLAAEPASLMDQGMVLLDGPDMVCHTVGIVTSENGKPGYMPITSIGKEWYNTSGSIDIILDRSQRVEFFFHNTLENEMEGSSCEITDLPHRPPKTSRIRIHVSFTGRTEGTILLEDMGFGEMFPATGKIRVFPFTLIS